MAGMLINRRTEISVRALVCCLLASVGLVLGADGQQENALTAGAWSNASTSDANSSPINIRVNSNLVVVPVTVTDGKGRVVNGLRKEHFALYEDKVEQPITHFAPEDAPVSIGLVIDTSDSMRPRIRKAREAAAALLENANRQDEFFLVQFSDVVQVLSNLTTRTEEIREQVEMMRVSGGTALLDAVAVALQQMKNAHHSRKAIIVISDGDDNASQYLVKELRDAVRQADVLIYAIGLGDSTLDLQGFPSDRITGAALLNDIANQTGGCLFEVHRLQQLPGVAAKISAWLRSQYVLAYTPSSANGSVNGNPGYHRIQVKVTKPNGFPKLHAVWRLGYYTPAP
jgi:Ca-activated chloride channel homolog